MRLDQLERELVKLKPYPEQIKLGVGLITNPQKMIDNHLKYLKAQSGNRVFLPYHERLVEVYKILKDDNTG